jgi:hypothetical protein
MEDILRRCWLCMVAREIVEALEVEAWKEKPSRRRPDEELHGV